MRFKRIVFLDLIPPLIATIVLHLLSLFEPFVRSVLGSAQATEAAPFPETFLFTIVFWYIPFLILHSLYRMISHFLKDRIGTSVILGLMSVGITLVLAIVIHSPEVDKNFMSSLGVMFYLIGIPFLTSEVITFYLLKKINFHS
jgi:hypothetical protein